MPGMPSADIEITAEQVQGLVRRHLRSPLIDDAPPRRAATGWDCETWRVGDTVALRLPRRAAAAHGLAHEQVVMPTLSRNLAAAGVGAPDVVYAGRPDETFPYPWSLVTWHEGTAGLQVPRAERRTWAAPLARAVAAIHRTSPGDLPPNPVRGGALVTRAGSISARLADLRTDARIRPKDVDLLARLWDAGLAAQEWRGAPTLIHGDLHPGNLIARGRQLVAVIDFIDVAPGDPAYDLAVAWLCFDARGRRAFIAGMGEAFTAEDWIRARAWAAAFTVILLGHSDDAPAYAALARETLAELRPE